MADALIEMRGIVKTYPGVAALDGVDFSLRAGEIHALVGENGAGKSTLIKILTGAERRDRGTVTLEGAAIDPRTPVQAQRLGIATVYQEVNLIPDLTVAENILLGREPRGRLGAIRWGEMMRRAQQVVDKLGLHVDIAEPLRACSIAVQQMIAVARAIDQHAKVLVLDEPTSSLDATETAQLFALMRRLREAGMGIIFITHFLDQVYEVSDRITVLRGGRLVDTHVTNELPRLALVAQMLGKSIEDVSKSESRGRPAADSSQQECLRASRVFKRNAVQSFDLSLKAGEVLGLAGLLGSGRTEVVRLLFGIDQRDGGELSICGESIGHHSPRRAIKAGMALTPEDRRAAGLVPHLSVRENMLLALQGAKGWARRVSVREQQAIADRYVRALSISTPDIEKPVSQLSGGNQQKVILARWLLMEPTILMLDEPTRGIDIGAKEQIELLIDELRSNGMALIFISGELDEVVRVSQRIMVLRDRAPVGELSGENLNTHAVMRQIAGETAGQAHA